jgi:hypothetical protein
LTAAAPPEIHAQHNRSASLFYPGRPPWTMSWRDALMVGGGAILVRGIICVFVLLFCHTTFSKYADLFDGRSYLITARAMAGDWSQFDNYQGRVFPGFPAMIAMLHRASIPIPIAAVGLDWLGAGLAAGAVVLLFQDIRVGCAIAVLMPHYLMNSSLALSEAPMLGLSCLGLLMLWQEESERPLPLARVILGGLLLGASGVVRPMACFAAIAFGAVAASKHRWRDLALVTVTAGSVVLVSLIAAQQWRGDALAGVRYYANSDLTYGGQLLTWPFHSLIAVSFSSQVPLQRILYIWLHVALVLAACLLAIRGLIEFPKISSLDLLAGVWLLTNTAFVLCVGSVWGFQCFHRFAVPALPPAYWFLRKFLPSRWIEWIVISATSGALATFTIVHELRAL